MMFIINNAFLFNLLHKRTMHIKEKTQLGFRMQFKVILVFLAKDIMPCFTNLHSSEHYM